MKNGTTVRRLTLNRETVRTLSDTSLEQAVGGQTIPTGTTGRTQPCYALSKPPSCLPSCYCTPIII